MPARAGKQLLAREPHGAPPALPRHAADREDSREKCRTRPGAGKAALTGRISTPPTPPPPPPPLSSADARAPRPLLLDTAPGSTSERADRDALIYVGNRRSFSATSENQTPRSPHRRARVETIFDARRQESPPLRDPLGVSSIKRRRARWDRVSQPIGRAVPPGTNEKGWRIFEDGGARSESYRARFGRERVSSGRPAFPTGRPRARSGQAGAICGRPRAAYGRERFIIEGQRALAGSSHTKSRTGCASPKDGATPSGYFRFRGADPRASPDRRRIPPKQIRVPPTRNPRTPE
jgi:hypothetical protein